MENKKILRDIVMKSMHKVNGVIFELNDIHPNRMIVVISKKKTRQIAFVAYGDMIKKIKDNFKLKDRIKIRFYAMSKKYKDRWYTDLIIFDVFEWKKNEKKLAIQASLFKAEEEAKYLKPQKFDWQDELEKFNNASEKK